ncbi:uncharacterized protein LOC124357656 [Homalodisca vitripennis]|uniref:uncharacterized protein LOC124357656 n=1 Tax=Homalodisca vitripennis TaxID=197043 RepID=UPI001EECC0CE|nr:uncharacterized protein LOC124357656 [Homalodisca vitripennis]
MYEFDISSLFSDIAPRKMTGIIGSVGEFDSNEETWDSYIERFELFLSCNDIDHSKKVSTLLTVVGVKTFKLLRDLCTPDKPSTKSYDDLVKLINDHLYPTPSFVCERYKFSLRNQHDGESIAQYIAQLKNLSKYCEFGASLNDYLRDRLICGIRSESTKQRLLSEANLTFDKAVQLTSQIEMAEKSAATLASGSHDTPAVSVRSVHRLATSSARRHYNGRESAPSGRDNASRHHATPSTTHAHQSSSTSVVKCNCCGAVGHFSKQCKYYGCVCHKCGKTNHLKKVCRSQARVTDQTAEVITAESQQTARSDCADDNPVGSNRTADAPRHSISVRPSTAMSPNASHTHTTYTSPITQRSPLARSTPVCRYPQRERKPITRLDL